MTGKERVMTALNFKQPDKVPVDFNGHRSSGISIGAYKRLLKYLDLPPRPLYIYDFIQQLAIVDNDVLDLFHSDVFQLGCDFNKNPAYWQDWQMQDKTICKIPASIDVRETTEGSVVYNCFGKPIAIQKHGCLYFEQMCFPLADDFDKEDFSDWKQVSQDIMWAAIPCPPMPVDYLSSEGNAQLREIAAKTRGSTDRAIYGIFGGSIVETGQQTFRIDNYLCELLANPERIHAYLDVLLEHYMSSLERYLDAVGDYIDVIGFGDDMGSQIGPQFSTAIYEEFFKPRHNKMWNYVHQRYPEMKICLHCCGGVRPLLQHLIEAGLDAINPVQFVSAGMDLDQIKAEFGKKLTFWGGGCDTREVLPKASPDAIHTHVKKNIEIMNEGGGFIYQQVHNILDDVPPENIVAMFRAVD